MKRRTLTLLTAALLVIAACGEEGTSETTVADTGDTTTSAAVEEETTTTAAAAEETTTPASEPAAEGVSTAETDLGSILVDAEGFTLYIFTNDTEGTSTCYDDCAANWPAVPGQRPRGGWGLVRRRSRREHDRRSVSIHRRRPRRLLSNDRRARLRDVSQVRQLRGVPVALRMIRVICDLDGRQVRNGRYLHRVLPA